MGATLRRNGERGSTSAAGEERNRIRPSGVYATNNTRDACDHLVAIVGFGGEGSGAYWIVQNSFGSSWGERGFFRIKRASALAQGEYNLGIGTQRVSWAMPATA